MKDSLFPLAVAAVLLAALVVPEVRAAEPPVIKLWDGPAPGEVEGEVGEEGLRPDDRFRILQNVSEPRITIFSPDKDKNTGTAVVVCPGGGYSILADEHEGSEVCEWLNTIGVTGVLLQYRVPKRKGRPMYEAPLQDVQRALRTVRLRADEWGIDPGKVGVLGFSAGGHLTIMAGTKFNENAYKPDGEEEKFSARPDFIVPVYAAFLIEKDGSLVPEISIGDDVPPPFFAHAGDDRHSAEGSARLYIEWRRRNIPAEIHVYAKGGHGFGMRDHGNPVNTWPQRCGEWMKSMGWLEKK